MIEVGINLNNKLFDDVMNMILAGDDIVLQNLRKQYENSSLSVEMTQVGFFVDFIVDEKVSKEKISSKNFHIGEVSGRVSDKEYGVGFVLFVEDGLIVMLEGYTLECDVWPSEEKITLHYDPKREEMIEQLREQSII